MLQPVLNTAPPAPVEAVNSPPAAAAEAPTDFGQLLGAIRSAQADSSSSGPQGDTAALPPAADAAPPSLLDSTLGAASVMMFQVQTSVAPAEAGPASTLAEGAPPASGAETIAPASQQNLPVNPADLAALNASLQNLNSAPASVAELTGRNAASQLPAGATGLVSTLRAALDQAGASVPTVAAGTGVAVAAATPSEPLSALAATSPSIPSAPSAGPALAPAEAMPPSVLTPQAKSTSTPASLIAASAQAFSSKVDAPPVDAEPLLTKPSDALTNRVLPAFTETTASVGRPVAATQATTAGEATNPQGLSPLAGQAQPATEMAQSGSRVVSHVAAPLLSREWRSELSDRVAWMVGRQAQSAEIILNPPALGSIEVRLNMNLAGNEAGAQFFSANANVRDALESAFPRLRELMANMGITLGEASVSSQSFGERQAGSESGQAKGQGGEPTLFGAAMPGTLLTGVSRSQGLVDLYI
jgi:flagellar hook-length control protein FliK